MKSKNVVRPYRANKASTGAPTLGRVQVLVTNRALGVGAGCMAHVSQAAVLGLNLRHPEATETSPKTKESNGRYLYLTPGRKGRYRRHQLDHQTPERFDHLVLASPNSTQDKMENITGQTAQRQNKNHPRTWQYHPGKPQLEQEKQ